MSRSLPAIVGGFFPLPAGEKNRYNLLVGEKRVLLCSQPHHKLRSGAWSGGGEFLQVTSKVTHGTQPWTMIKNGSLSWGTAGGVGSLAGHAGVPQSGVSDATAIANSGGSIDSHRSAAAADFAAGWRKTRPGNPEASLAQFIAELRDFPSFYGKSIGKQFVGKTSKTAQKKLRAYKGSFLRGWLAGPTRLIPYRIQMQLGVFRSLGEEYLNHVFGWVPFVRDLQQLYVLSQTIDNRIRQIQRDNNRGIRRKATVSHSKDTTSTQKSFNTAWVGASFAPPNWGHDGGSVWSSVSTIERKAWFSARYRYYIPDVTSPDWISKAKRTLAGADITPSLLWELTPWSWLTDWFLDVGDVISNFSENAVSNLVADYSYCMVNTIVTAQNTSIGSWGGYNQPVPPFIWNIPAYSHNLASTYEVNVKARVAGSPYGLGVKWPSLSGRQVGILAALGITQARF